MGGWAGRDHQGVVVMDALAMNVTTEVGNCTNPLEEVDWSQPGLIISLVILGSMNVLVLLGNCLVVLAVFLDQRLRTVTNLFIVSLAMADLSVGIAVLPFSASLEVLDMWIFGEIWCSIWLAVDVWMCTASILNLCAISLDRYLAVTRPVSYPSIMTPWRAKVLLAVVWLLSFLICFPPLVGWNDRKVSNRPVWQQHCDHWTCELTNDPGYVVYSALGSFFIPMLVMLFFYWRIYRAAVKTTKAINQGFRTTKVFPFVPSSSSSSSSSFSVSSFSFLFFFNHFFFRLVFQLDRKQNHIFSKDSFDERELFRILVQFPGSPAHSFQQFFQEFFGCVPILCCSSNDFFFFLSLSLSFSIQPDKTSTRKREKREREAHNHTDTQIEKAILQVSLVFEIIGFIHPSALPSVYSYTMLRVYTTCVYFVFTPVDSSKDVSIHPSIHPSIHSFIQPT